MERSSSHTSMSTRACLLAVAVAAASGAGALPVSAADPVNQERLLNVDKEAGNWLHHHQNYAAHRFSTLRAVLMAKDIRDAFPDEDQLQLVMAGQGTLGVSSGNSIRINGGSTLDTDADFVAAGGGDPIDYFDGFVWAGYFEATSAFDTANLATIG